MTNMEKWAIALALAAIGAVGIVVAQAQEAARAHLDALSGNVLLGRDPRISSVAGRQTDVRKPAECSALAGYDPPIRSGEPRS